MVGGFVFFILHGRQKDLKTYCNAEGYHDPTACGAIENIESKERARKLLRKIWALCEKHDFEVVDRITLYDKQTGRIYK